MNQKIKFLGMLALCTLSQKNLLSMEQKLKAAPLEKLLHFSRLVEKNDMNMQELYLIKQQTDYICLNASVYTAELQEYVALVYANLVLRGFEIEQEKNPQLCASTETLLIILHNIRVLHPSDWQKGFELNRILDRCQAEMLACEVAAFKLQTQTHS